jgi:glucose-1-phosphate thymidylyltransferase
VPLVMRYLAEGNPPDQPGRLVAWLYPRGAVYGYRFGGAWFDVGSPDQLLEADNCWRAKSGLPQRESYSTLS